jgi:hypothetical protein
MTLRVKPGTKVRARPPSSLAGWIGYVSHESSVIPNHERVFFPDLDVTLTFGHEELDMWAEEGALLSDLFVEADEEVRDCDIYKAVNQRLLQQQDPGDENDYDDEWADCAPDDDAFDPWANYEIHEGEDFVREINENNHGFDAEVYVADGDIISHLVSLNISHLFDGEPGDTVGILLTPDAAYSLAELLLDAAADAETNAAA